LTLSYEEDRILRSLAGSEAVRDLSVRQAQAFAAGDAATWIGTFVVGGELELPGGEIVRGHVALGDWFANADRSGTSVSTASVVTIDGVRGTQQSTVLRLAGRPAGGAMVESVHSVFDDVIYERGRWYFSRRRMLPGFPGQ
jgi:SnoaL-like protein